METQTKPTPVTTNTGDHDRFAHYIKSNGVRTAKSIITAAIVTGTPIRALCGKLWIPSRDPYKFPICPDCDRIRIRAMMLGR